MTRVSPVTAQELLQNRSRKVSENHETYRHLFMRLSSAVREFSKTHPMETTFYFTVPPLIFGRPVYDRSHAVRYVLEKARIQGFKTRDLGHGRIMLDWTPEPKRIDPPPPPYPSPPQSSQSHLQSQHSKKKTKTSKQKEKRKESISNEIASARDARQTARNLNDHLERLLKTLE